MVKIRILEQYFKGVLFLFLGGGMVSKIYEKYLQLKEENEEKLYLFKSGKFYIFLGDDCKKINEYVVLKRIPFCKETEKCGFPENVLEDYLRVFQNHKLDIEIIKDFTLEKKDNLYDYIENIDLNQITPLDAFHELIKINEMLENDKRSRRY